MQCIQTNPKISLKEDLEVYKESQWQTQEWDGWKIKWDTKSVKINSSDCLNEFRKKKLKNQKYNKVPKLGNIKKKSETLVWKKKSTWKKDITRKINQIFPFAPTKHLQFSDIKRSDIQRHKHFCLSHNTIISWTLLLKTQEINRSTGIKRHSKLWIPHAHKG